MSPTMAEILELPEVQRGHPTVLSGQESLDRCVRWVHVLEVTDVEGLLLGGELVLTTGVGLPHSHEELRQYIQALHAAGASGLFLQLGDRWTDVPKPLVAAATARGLPLIALRTKVPFVAITEAVHVSIVSAQLAELRASERLHEVFTRLGLGAVTAEEIVREVADLVHAPIVLENANHRVLAANTSGQDREQILLDWEHRSRRTPDEGSTAVVGLEQWMVTPVGTQGAPWGRLVMLSAREPTRMQAMALERAAEALVLRRLIAADELVFERAAYSGLLDDVRNARYRTSQDMAVRLHAAGVPVLGKRMQAIVICLADATTSSHQQVDAVRNAIEQSRGSALVGVCKDGVAALLALDKAHDPAKRLGAVAARVCSVLEQLDPGARVTVAAGRLVDGVEEAPTSFREAEQVAAAAPHLTDPVGVHTFVSLRDVGIRGLIALLKDDPRLQLFVEDSLGPLLNRAPGGPSGQELLDVLDAYLSERGNKSSAAAHLHMSRPAFYSRLDLLQRELDVDFTDAQSVLALHFALVAYDVLAPRGRPLAERAPLSRARG